MGIGIRGWGALRDSSYVSVFWVLLGLCERVLRFFLVILVLVLRFVFFSFFIIFFEIVFFYFFSLFYSCFEVDRVYFLVF